MKVEVREESIATLSTDYASVPIAFTVERTLEIPRGSHVFLERPVPAPYVKNYDAIEHPSRWPTLFDVSKWGVISARVEGQRVGGAVIAFYTVGVRMLDERIDLVALWDIRVSPSLRGRGIGSALFGAVERWAIQRKCRELVVETQNNNVSACRFYEHHGCTLKAVNDGAYPTHPTEIQLIFQKRLVV